MSKSNKWGDPGLGPYNHLTTKISQNISLTIEKMKFNYQTLCFKSFKTYIVRKKLIGVGGIT